MLSRRPLRVLLVDDDPLTLELLEHFIRERFPGDMQVKATTDSAAAERFLDAEVIDLLITDLQMPEIDGIELLRRAKAKNAWTQVLMLTGHSDLCALTDAMELGADDYMLKPFDPDGLQEEITAALRRLGRWQKAVAGTLAAR